MQAPVGVRTETKTEKTDIVHTLAAKGNFYRFRQVAWYRACMPLCSALTSLMPS